MKLPDYPVRGQPVTARWGRDLVDYLRSITLRSSPTVRVTHSSGGTVLEAAQRVQAATQGFPWHLRTFGFTPHVDAVTIVNGRLHWGRQVHTVANTKIDLTTYGSILYVGVQFDGTTLSYPDPSTDIEDFEPDDAVFRTFLYGFYRPAEGQPPVLAALGHEGLITLDAAWGPS